MGNPFVKALQQPSKWTPKGGLSVLGGSNDQFLKGRKPLPAGLSVLDQPDEKWQSRNELLQILSGLPGADVLAVKSLAGLAEGRSRILSLRNKKTGEPHVTVEIQPHTEGMKNLVNQDVADEHGLNQTARIIQIKGKQNKAPNPEYLPYVQDLVKSGKWGDVGDIQNTGLMRHPDTGDWIPIPEDFAQGGSVQSSWNNVFPQSSWNGVFE